VRILVTGSRDWTDARTLERALDGAVRGLPADELVILVHGGNPHGADALAHAEGLERGWVIEVHEALWTVYNLAAGAVRNQEMVNTKPDVCVAFIRPCRRAGACKDANGRAKPKPHDSHGTADCIERAKAAGIDVREYR
jgi:hypothetical protein